MNFGDPLKGVGTLPGAPGAFVVPVGNPPLAGMPYPGHGVQWDAVAAGGVTRVLDLSGLDCTYDCTPLERVPLGLQDLAGGVIPDNEEQERERIRAAVGTIAVAREDLNGVLVHCVGGRGRTGTVLGAYLVKLGFTPSMVIDWLNQAYKRRGKPGWPESHWQSDLLEEFQ